MLIPHYPGIFFTFDAALVEVLRLIVKRKKLKENSEEKIVKRK